MNRRPHQSRHLSPASHPPRSRQRGGDGTNYRPPRLVEHGSLGTMVRGASWKGVDSIGELDPEEGYPG